MSRRSWPNWFKAVWSRSISAWSRRTRDSVLSLYSTCSTVERWIPNFIRWVSFSPVRLRILHYFNTLLVHPIDSVIYNKWIVFSFYLANFKFIFSIYISPAGNWSCERGRFPGPWEGFHRAVMRACQWTPGYWILEWPTSSECGLDKGKVGLIAS